ncbi:MAG: hypothetical protein VYB54_01095 [Pseudomonadota bacterium]|nr:hypothetical protein [Pseudomonadota bacterium]
MSLAALQPTAWRVPVNRLDETGRLFTWCVRTWVQGMSHRVDTGHEIRAALAAHRAEDGLAHLDAFLMVLATAARATIGVRLRRATMLGQDEIVLLRALDAAMDGNHELAEAVLDLVVGGTGRRLALTHLERLAAVLTCGGLACSGLPRPERQPAPVARGNVVRLGTGGRPDAA